MTLPKIRVKCDLCEEPSTTTTRDLVEHKSQFGPWTIWQAAPLPKCRCREHYEPRQRRYLDGRVEPCDS